MSDAYNKVKVIFKAGDLTEQQLTLIAYLKTTQFTVQAYDGNGDLVTLDGSTTVSLTLNPVGNPGGDAIPLKTLSTSTKLIETVTDVFLEGCAVSTNQLPAGATELHVTVMQSVY